MEQLSGYIKRVITKRISRNMIRRPQKARGFSLVELLVVIAIIALLFSLIMPTIESGMILARRAGCMTNSRQIHSALVLYAAEHDGRLPNLQEGFAGSVTWDLYLRPYDGRGEEADPRVPYDLYRCPGNFRYSSSSQNTKRNYKFGIYTNVIAEHLIYEASPGDPNSRVFVGQPISSIPSSAILLFDTYAGRMGLGGGSGTPEISWFTTNPDHAVFNQHSWRIGDGGLWGAIVEEPLHGNKFNYMYADGHGESLTYTDAWSMPDPLTQ